ncbi:MAG TPA: hypothetical protein VMS96_05630 [Terriglobales bacterium]|nr:hypothetical protein [Terriglobales bacterium]
MNQHIGFNPRSQANSNALCDFVMADLRESCPAFAANLDAKRLTPTKNADVWTRVACRNVDLVFLDAEAKTARAAVENKTIMTAHGKARWNRYGDLIAYCNHMHNHRPDCIASAIVIVNCSPAYENPDAFAKGLMRPKFDMAKVVKDTVKIFAGVPLRTSADEPNDQPEAIAVVVVDYDGQHPAKLVTGDLSPQADSPIHYESFIKRTCDLYRARFGRH